MKKQILLFIVAFVAFGLSQTIAQPTLTPKPLDATCIDLTDPLRPVPGNPYTYEVTIPNPPGGKSFRWFVTQDVTFITAGAVTATPQTVGGSILAAGEAHYNILTADADAIELTWKSFVLNPGQYVFVVVYVENVDDCTTNNLKVYRIQPLHAFTLDIENMSWDGTAGTIIITDLEQCVDDVQSAVFDPDHGTDGGVVYDFGTNTLHYAVVAANFSGQFELTAQISGLQDATADETVGQSATIYWGYTPNSETYSIGPLTSAANGVTQDLGNVLAEELADFSGTIGEDGQMIYIKVVIEHNSFEAAANADEYLYTLAINGRLLDNTGAPLASAADEDEFDDLHHEDCLPDLFTNDIVTQILKARPTVQSVTPPPAGYLPIAP